jgi:hypothetical protein
MQYASEQIKKWNNVKVDTYFHMNKVTTEPELKPVY